MKIISPDTSGCRDHRFTSRKNVFWRAPLSYLHKVKLADLLLDDSGDAGGGHTP
jgi:hypothetical protein